MVQAPAQMPVEYRVKCPRCGGYMFSDYEEPSCLRCGFVDYYSPVARVPEDSGSILNKGTQFILRYKGDSQWLINKLAKVKVVRVRNRVAYDLNCPFCGNQMEQASMSGHRKELKEERFKCGTGHRVSLIPSEEGVVGWK